METRNHSAPPSVSSGWLLVLGIGVFLLGLTDCNRKAAGVRSPVHHEPPPILITF